MLVLTYILHAYDMKGLCHFVPFHNEIMGKNINIKWLG